MTLRDQFWAPRRKTNARVTIPLEIAKLSETERGLNGGVLEAAIFTLQTGDNVELKTHVDTRVRAMLAVAEPLNGNRDFEIAASYCVATGDRSLIDKSIASAAALTREFREKDPPFSGGERDALNCVQLYHVTGDPAHLALARHYLDIRGRPDSIGRSRHNQSYRAVTEQREAVGHAVNGATLMLSLVDVGVLTGERAYFDAGQRMWATRSQPRCT